MPREIYFITLTRPDEMTPTELRDYIEIAVRQWGKGGDPGDPEWQVGKRPIKGRPILRREVRRGEIK